MEDRAVEDTTEADFILKKPSMMNIPCAASPAPFG